KGFGKKTALSEYEAQHRGGKGIKTSKITQKTGDLVDSIIVPNTGDILITSAKGQIIRIELKRVPKLGRSTQGVRLMKFDADDSVTSVIYIEKKEEP
nr:DNA gyrase subunit A [Patescibacteria group bacterium]